MITKNIPKDVRPIAAYNCDKQELIGVFESIPSARRYLYKHDVNLKLKKSLVNKIQFKSKLKDTFLGFPVAIRYANEAQITILNGKEYIILNGYPIPAAYSMKCFVDTAASLKKYIDYKRSIRFTEIKRIKNEKL